MNMHSIKSQRANYVCTPFQFRSCKSNQTKLFAILLIIRFSSIPESQYFSSNFRKPFYKECLIYIHGFDDQ